MRKPAPDLSDIVQKCSRSSGEHPKAALAARSCSIVLSGQAPKPRSGAPKARGLTAKAQIERSSACRDARCHRTLSKRSSPDFTEAISFGASEERNDGKTRISF